MARLSKVGKKKTNNPALEILEKKEEIYEIHISDKNGPNCCYNLHKKKCMS